ncbi:hypothetical protein EYC98_06390 [Halieaceae bacterium IMCC14734]|uniref:DUF3619 family protein n=1 Tax=Candidatus Litorirhabdus singularis TaxID=2518993 RepID=A0ABT3TDW4_9GAMM|nr:hypothetical protein [Candidatus Litorirhabdus singularis]MCX2980502.1 hypothetical protein [Candidatus Litorirhabdus singularis]
MSPAHDKHDMDTGNPVLAAHFARLRESEQLTAPAITRRLAVTETAAVRQWRLPSLPRAAAATAIAATVLVLLWQPAAEDPATIYLSILDQQSWSSDALLDVSEALLPALAPEPDFYQIDINFDLDSYAN